LWRDPGDEGNCESRVLASERRISASTSVAQGCASRSDWSRAGDLAAACYHRAPRFLPAEVNPMEVNPLRRTIEDLSERGEALRRFL
jgi:hypothetical protein